MAGEKKQKARIKSQPRTLSKSRVPEKPVVGSSSTWRKEQLDRFLVRQGVLDVREMIPQKWFDFGQLDNYRACCNHFLGPTNGSTGSGNFSTTR
jgi:hypothetical protein